jgi:GNAT superfamily N-acetyltransferase
VSDRLTTLFGETVTYAAGVIRSVRPDDVPALLGLVRELATFEREPDAVTATEADVTAALFGPTPALFGVVAEARQHSGLVAEARQHSGLVAEADGDSVIAGFALWFVSFSTWNGRHGIYLEDLYVKPEFRGHGYGRELVTALARVAHERGYGRVEWSVLDWNESAHRFYRSLHAVPMQEWTTWRLSGPALAALGVQTDADEPA